MDIGLLFDPASASESKLCQDWKSELAQPSERPKVALNQPYLGTDDGLTTSLRKDFGPAEYLGIELEINNRIFHRVESGRLRVLANILESLRRCCPLANRT